MECGYVELFRSETKERQRNRNYYCQTWKSKSPIIQSFILVPVHCRLYWSSLLPTSIYIKIFIISYPTTNKQNKQTKIVLVGVLQRRQSMAEAHCRRGEQGESAGCVVSARRAVARCRSARRRRRVAQPFLLPLAVRSLILIIAKPKRCKNEMKLFIIYIVCPIFILEFGVYRRCTNWMTSGLGMRADTT